MKKLVYDISNGIKVLRVSSIVILAMGILMSVIFLILALSQESWLFAAYIPAVLFFSLFYYGIGKCVATITELKIIKNNQLISELKKDGVEVEHLRYEIVKELPSVFSEPKSQQAEELNKTLTIPARTALVLNVVLS